MKRLFKFLDANYLWFFALLIMGGVVPLCAADEFPTNDIPELTLALYIDEQNTDGIFEVGEPVKVLMVIKNVSDTETIYTRKAFIDQLEDMLLGSLYLKKRSNEKVFRYDPNKIGLDPPPEDPEIEGVVLPADWARSIIINDLRVLFPEAQMSTTPDSFALEAHLQFPWFSDLTQKSTFLAAINGNTEVESTDPDNPLEFEIIPPGDQVWSSLNIRVLNNVAGLQQPVGGIEVRVFENSEVEGLPLADAWQGMRVVSGTTITAGEDQGYADWDQSCLVENDYTAVAKYQDAYRSVAIQANEFDSSTGCDTYIAKEIIFGADEFSVFATNSVWIRAFAEVVEGSVGVKSECEICLSRNKEILVGIKAKTLDLYGNRIKIKKWTSVDDVYYNQLDNSGTINGEEYTPLILPVWQEPPFHINDEPNGEDVYVHTYAIKDLDAGAYGDVFIKSKGTLRLNGGAYYFENLNLGTRSNLVCEETTEIRVKGRLYPGSKAYIGPTLGSTTVTAKDIVIYVGGVNGKNGHIRSNPKSAVIGVKNTVKANLYAPNGTLWIREGSEVEGCFIGKDVIIGVKTKVKLESGF